MAPDNNMVVFTDTLADLLSSKYEPLLCRSPPLCVRRVRAAEEIERPREPQQGGLQSRHLRQEEQARGSRGR